VEFQEFVAGGQAMTAAEKRIARIPVICLITGGERRGKGINLEGMRVGGLEEDIEEFFISLEVRAAQGKPDALTDIAVMDGKPFGEEGNGESIKPGLTREGDLACKPVGGRLFGEFEIKDASFRQPREGFCAIGIQGHFVGLGRHDNSGANIRAAGWFDQ